MKVEVEVFSWVNIKPSSPTPPHLKTYKLSFLDQIAPQVFMPFILFYESNNDSELSNLAKSKKLQASLSETLTRFYPLAGRTRDKFLIDCNDEGVPFLEARVKCRLSAVVHDPSPGSFNKFLPHELDVISDKPLAIQVSFFECGGMAVTVCINHIIGDAFSKAILISCWSAISRRDHTRIFSPQFDSAEIFPPRNITRYDQRVGIDKEKVVVRRFVFKNSVIASLVDKYTDKNDQDSATRPTRVGALSTFIWNRYVAVTRKDEEVERPCLIVHAVNLRTRMNPPLPWYSFGNYFRIAITPTSLQASNECQELVKEIRDSIKDLDDNYVADLKAGIGHLSSMEDLADEYKKGMIVTMSFTSLCNFPIYDHTDFGWGKPVRVGSCRLVFKNVVIFMDTREGEGVDAWVNMEEEDMAKFEVDKELLAHVSPISRY